MLAREFSGSRIGPLLAAALVLLSPEVNSAAATGAMHMLAIGFEVMAMAIFAAKFDRRRNGAWRGALAVCSWGSPPSRPAQRISSSSRSSAPA